MACATEFRCGTFKEQSGNTSLGMCNIWYPSNTHQSPERQRAHQAKHVKLAWVTCTKRNRFEFSKKESGWLLIPPPPLPHKRNCMQALNRSNKFNVRLGWTLLHDIGWSQQLAQSDHFSLVFHIVYGPVFYVSNVGSMLFFNYVLSKFWWFFSKHYPISQI
jgi:hypothetical protein